VRSQCVVLGGNQDKAVFGEGYILNTLVNLSNKVIALYEQDTKEMESKLKEVKTSEQILDVINPQ
jgi:hypothetical protein